MSECSAEVKVTKYPLSISDGIVYNYGKLHDAIVYIGVCLMSQELLFEYNPWWEEEYRPVDLLPREDLENELGRLIPSKSVVFLTGLRRVGKTTLMKKAIKRLLDQGISAKSILYVSMDDYLLRDKTILEVISE
jgi:predicted AAA+ superfamily ATPase